MVLRKHPIDKPPPNKLAAHTSSPYEVVTHSKNDITCGHLALGTTKEYYVGTLKPFFGTLAVANELEMIDADQYSIDRLLAYRGSLNTRTTMEFLALFQDDAR